MYSLHIKKESDREKHHEYKMSELTARLQVRREKLQSRSRQRCNDWLQTVDADDVKNIISGAMRQTHQP
jgi:hypothetical protein